jgi:hypothetical protein
MDPTGISLNSTAGLVLSEGVKFLYGQATDLLRRRQDRKDRRAGDPSDALPPLVVPPYLLQGELSARHVDDGVLARYEGQLAEMRRVLSDYVDGIRQITHSDAQVVGAAEAIRGMLEIIYGQRITFAGEQREASGSRLSAEDERRAGRLVVQVLAYGAGAVAVGGDNTGSITTNPGIGNIPDSGH